MTDDKDEIDDEFTHDYNCLQDDRWFHTDDVDLAWGFVMSSWSPFRVFDREGMIRTEFITS